MDYTKTMLPWSFGLMCSLWIANAFTALAEYFLLIGLVWIVIIFHTFVVSVIYLAKYKERKALAITALVLSSYLIITLIVGVGIAIGILLGEF